MDAFCGVGGNAVHFARRCRHVIGVDNCRARLELAQQNARVYGVAERLDLICADFFDLRDQLKVGSPPGSEKTIFCPLCIEVTQEGTCNIHAGSKFSKAPSMAAWSSILQRASTTASHILGWSHAHAAL